MWGNRTKVVVAIRAGVLGIVTNSHCTNTQGGVESTAFYQPTFSTANRIGVETVDPQYRTGGECPSGRECRYSDSAFVQLDPLVTASMGYIARPTGINSGTTIDHNNPHFRIVNENITPYLGDLVNKVGRSTGWTQGNISRTCVNTNPDIPNRTITLLCQDKVTAVVDLGDSGSPVFRITNSPSPGDVILYGILWGKSPSDGSFWFSRNAFVQRSDELGTLQTCASGGC